MSATPPRWEDRPLWHVTLPWRRPPLMANDTGRLAASMADRARTRDDVCLLARSLRLQPITVPVVAILTWYTNTRQVTDSDNIAPTLKRCLDGLRLARVLADDTARHVVFTGQRVYLRDRHPYGVGSPARVILSLYDGSTFSLPHVDPSPPATLAAQASLLSTPAPMG